MFKLFSRKAKPVVHPVARIDEITRYRTIAATMDRARANDPMRIEAQRQDALWGGRRCG